MAFDFKAARDAGYSDAEIVGFLRESGAKFDFDAAQKAGYKDEEIAGFLEQRSDTLFPKEKPGLVERAVKGVTDFASGIVEQTKEDLGYGKGALDETAPAAKDVSSKASPVAPMRQDYYEKLRRASIAAPDQAAERAKVDDTTGRALTHITDERKARLASQRPQDLAGIIDTQQIAPVREEPEAEWREVIKGTPAYLASGLNSFVENFRKLNAESGVEHGLAAADRLMSGEPLSPMQRREMEHRVANMKEFIAMRGKAEKGIAQNAIDAALISPRNPTDAQQAYISLVQSAPPLALGTATMIATRNPVATWLVMGGGGAAMSGSATYEEARKKGRTPQQARAHALTDAGLEIFGEALPVYAAFQKGVPWTGKLFRVIAAEAGEEVATQFMQDVHKWATYDPKITWPEMVKNMKIAGLAGAGGGAIFGVGAALSDRLAGEPGAQARDTTPVPAADVLGRPEPEVAPAPDPRDTADFDTAAAPAAPPVADEPIPFRQEDVDLGRAEGAYDAARAAEEVARAREAAEREGIPYEPGVAPAAPEPAPAPLPPKESVAAAFDVAEADAAAQRDAEMEALARQARDLRADEEISTAEARGQGLVEGSTPVEAAMESPRIFGRSVEAASDTALKLVAEKGRGEAQRAAQAELAKRAFERDLKAAGDPATASTLAAIRSAQPSQKLASRPAFERLRSDQEARGVKIENVPEDGVPAPMRRVAEAISTSFGKQVVFVNADPKKYEGSMYADDPSTVYVNVSSDLTRGMRSLIGHEMTHALKRSNPRVYTDLLRAIAKTTRGRAAAERYVKRYGDQPTEIQIEEMVAEMRGDFMDDPRFWLEVFRASKQPLVKKLAQAIRMIFDTLRMKLRIGERRISRQRAELGLKGDRDPGYGTRSLINNIEAARKAFARAYAEWEAQPNAPAPQAREDMALASKPEPSYVGSNMPWKKSADGRFTVYKYDSTTRGSSAVKGAKYTVFDSEDGKTVNFEKLDFVNSFIHYKRTGVRTKPWFGSATEDAPVAELVDHPEAKGYHHPAPRWDRKNDKLDSRPEGGSLPDDIRKQVAEREAEARGKVAVWKAQGRYKWDRGQVLLSKKTGKLWTIISQFIGQRRNAQGAREDVPMYVAQHSSPDADDWIKSTLYADKAHESMVPVGKEMLDSRPDLKALIDKLPKTEEGKFKAAPERTARDVWNLVQRMESMAKEGAQSKGWYEDSAKEMLRAFGGNKVAAKIFAQVIAITSANTEVKANFTQADKALFQFAQGRAISVGTGSVDEKLNDLLYFGIPWEGRKTNVFYTNLVEAIDGKRPSETTQDMHMGMIGFGKKKITDDEYTFMDLVTKHVAERVGMTPQQAQAAIWVTQKARSLVERYEEKGWHSDKTPQTKRRMALVDAGINYGDLIRGRGWFWPDQKTEFQKAAEVRAKGMKVTAEVKPSTKLEIGQAVANLSIAKLQAYQRDALARVFGARGPAALMEEMGLDRSKYRIVEGAGGYDASMAPNEIITLNTDHATALRVAKAWMYIFRQDAVPFFRADPALADDPKAAQGVQITFAERLSNPLLRKVFDSLREQVHPGIGLTKISANEIAIVNFRGEDGKPFLMEDGAFLDALQAAVDAKSLGAKISDYGRFGAETEYPFHDWQSEPSGASLYEEAGAGRPDLQDRLRRWADAFGRFAEKRGGQARALESRPEEVDSGAVLDARAHHAATSEANDKPLPTEAQKAAGNYPKGHVRLMGLDITIENPEGSERTWKRADGTTGSTTMKAHYGYIKATVGADGDQFDVFIKPGTPLDYEGPVHVADQTKSGSNRFDEHKGLIGWKNAKEALDAYKENYSKGWDGLEGVVTFENPTKFKAWLAAADLNKRAGTQVLLESRPDRDIDTRTTEFKKWFEGSKVVDERGDPLVVYHSSVADIGDGFKLAVRDWDSVTFRRIPGSTQEVYEVNGNGKHAGTKQLGFLISKVDGGWHLVANPRWVRDTAKTGDLPAKFKTVSEAMAFARREMNKSFPVSERAQHVPAFFFSSDPSYSEKTFAKSYGIDDWRANHDNEGVTYPVYLSLKNPVDAEVPGTWEKFEPFYRRWHAERERSGGSPISMEEIGEMFRAGRWEVKEGVPGFVEEAKRLGYDGFISREGTYSAFYGKMLRGADVGGVKVFAAFYPNQIKSIFNERPTDSPRLLESKPDDADIAAHSTSLGMRALENEANNDLDFTRPTQDSLGVSSGEHVVVPIDEVDAYLEGQARGAKVDSGRAGAVSFRIEWASQPRDGDWISLTADGRYRIGRYENGFTVEVDEDIVAWFRSRRQAIAKANALYRQEVASGTVQGPQDRSPLLQYTSEQWNRVVDGWKKLAANPVIFRYKTSTRKNLFQIAEDMGVTDRIINIEQDDQYDSLYGGPRVVSFTEYTIKFWNETFSQIIHSVRHKEAHISANYLVKDSQLGSVTYQMALTWAHNNGIKIVPDPAGLTSINTFRRTEQMLSNALRFGTTRHMRPHNDQGLLGWEDKPTTEEQDNRNIALMALKSLENLMKYAPERAKQLIYNFETRRFEYGPDAQAFLRGKPAATADLEKMAKSPELRSIGTGRTTLARAIFTKSLIYDEAGAKAFLDGKVSAGMVLAGPDAKENLQLYSQPEEPAHNKHGPIKRALFATAKGATHLARPLVTAADIANATMDMVAKIPGVPVGKITGYAYDRFMSWQSNFWRAGEIRQAIAHAVTADYGLPEPYLDRRDERDIEVQKHLRKSKQMIDKIAALDDAESRVAYLWMQEKPNEAEEQRLLALLPEGSRQALAEMKVMLAGLGREAAALGLISEETLERNEMAYLHRSYKKYEVENPQAVAASSRAKQIRADSFRGRGLRDDVAAERLPAAQKGDKYVRLELRAAAQAGLGMLKRVVYLKAGTPIPAAYASWRNDGVWEARFMDRPGAVGLWRDFTVDERERMGEIREVRYAFARTMIGLVHDIETARFLKWVMETNSVADEEAVAEKGGTVADAIDNAFTLKSYSDNEWVQVPGTVAQGTRLFKYGALQSRYIPGHIWNDIRATINMRSNSAVWRLYDELLTAWKVSKTALSPVVHTNNVMANLVFMDIQDIKNRHLVRALQTLIDAERGNEEARALLERYLDSGAELGTPALHELRKEVIEPLLGKLQGEENETLAQISTIQAIGLAARGNVRQSWAALSSKGLSRLAAKPFHTMLAAYQLEDSVFRMASWMKSIEDGHSDRDAGTNARKHFLDYRINAPWIQALRRGPFPFFAFTYRAVPLMAEAAAKKPWKLMKYAAAGYLLNSLAYAMLGLGGDDERKERALLPEEKSGHTILGVPRLLRMPWNDKHGSPVFLDIRRWVPGGDLFDIHGSHSAIPMPSWLSVGGFWGLAMELVSNKNAFTGKEIWTESDSNTDRMLKVFDHLFRFMSPNVPFPNPVGYAADALAVEKGMLQTYAWRTIQAAGSGMTDDFGRERSLAQSMASAVGVKLASYPPDQLRRNIVAKRDFELRDLNEATARYRREFRRGGITKAEFDARMQKQAEKRREIRQRYGEKLGLEPVSR
jgi:hypothetical protein